MKCPKCHYISYDSPDRCRNCGFDFSLLVEEPPMRPDVADGALADLDLRPAAPTPATPGAPAAPAAPDMPLFHEPVAGVDDTPLIRKPSPPRPPLAVRRSPETARPRPARAAVVTPPRPEPDLVFDDDPLLGVEPDSPAPPIIVPPPDGARAVSPEEAGPVAAATESPGAAPARRIGAAAVDVAVLAAIDLAVVHFTLKLTGLDWASVLDLRWAPMLGFFAVMNAGYFVAFTTAAGQTIGKMLAGIRVVTRDGGRVPLGIAIVRTAAMLVSLAPLGLGWAPAIVSRAMPALHDRLAGTRVVDL